MSLNERTIFEIHLTNAGFIMPQHMFEEPEEVSSASAEEILAEREDEIIAWNERAKNQLEITDGGAEWKAKQIFNKNHTLQSK